MQQLHIMVSLTARTDRLVSVAGLKHAWRILENDSLLATLIFESNDNVSHSLSSRKNKSLRCSAGLLELMELRNKAQCEDLQREDCNPECNLFPEALAKTKEKQLKYSLQDAKLARESPSGIEFSITVDNTSFPIVALRPVRSSDRLWIAYTEETLGPVIKYVRAAAFKEDLMSHHIDFDSDDLYHRGIRARHNDKKHPYIVAKKNKEGKIRHRCVASVDDAVAFLQDHADANDSGDIGGSEPGSSA